MLFSASVPVGNERYYAVNEGKLCRAQHRGKDLLGAYILNYTKIAYDSLIGRTHLCQHERDPLLQ